MNFLRQQFAPAAAALATTIAIVGGCDDGYSGKRSGEARQTRRVVAREVEEVMSPPAAESTSIPNAGVPANKLTRAELRKRNAALREAEEQKRIDALNKFTSYEADFCIGDRTGTQNKTDDLEVRYTTIKVVTKDAREGEFVPTAQLFDGTAEDDVRLGDNTRLYRPLDNGVAKGDRGKIYIRNTQADESNLCGYSAVPVGKNDNVTLRVTAPDESVRTSDFSFDLSSLPKCNEACATVQSSRDTAEAKCKTVYDKCMGKVADDRTAALDRISHLTGGAYERAEARLYSNDERRGDACSDKLSRCRSKQPNWTELAKKALEH